MSAPWIEASRIPKVPGTNAHASAITPLIFLILHISWMTFAFVMFVIVWIAVLSIKGRDVKWLLNKGKCSLRGARISARPIYYRRRVLKTQSYDDCQMTIFRRVE